MPPLRCYRHNVEPLKWVKILIYDYLIKACIQSCFLIFLASLALIVELCVDSMKELGLQYSLCVKSQQQFFFLFIIMC